MTQEAKHTPGPWQTKPEEVDKPYVRVRGTQLGRRYKIANVLTPFYEGVPEFEAEQTRANAHLIAAAPELLAALEWARTCVPYPSDCHNAIVDAIAKAKGLAA